MNNQIIKYKKALIILLALFLLSTFLAALFYQRSKKLQLDFLNSGKIRTVKLTQHQTLLAELEKRMVLPKGNPLIFNVSDLPQLTTQNFFNGSKPTDKLPHERKVRLHCRPDLAAKRLTGRSFFFVSPLFFRFALGGFAGGYV